MGFEATSHYYSGQGVVMIGTRSALGKPVSLRPIGNVSDLKIAIETTTQEHHESQTGTRGVDLRLETEIKATFAATLESIIAANLDLALRSTYSSKFGATVTDEAVTGYAGSVLPLGNINLTSITNVKRAAQALTAYVNDATPYDYKTNLSAGSVQLNDGSVVAIDKLTTGGTVPSAITVGNPTRVTVANTAAVGQNAVFSGFAGADAALINGKTFRIVAATATYVDLDVDTTGKTITLGTPLSFFDGTALTSTYVHAGHIQVDALINPATDYFVRFEGLNTADGNKPVIVDIFRMQSAPLKELALIADTVQNMVLEGTILYDSLQSSGSKYFRERLLR